MFISFHCILFQQHITSLPYQNLHVTISKRMLKFGEADINQRRTLYLVFKSIMKPFLHAVTSVTDISYLTKTAKQS